MLGLIGTIFNAVILIVGIIFIPMFLFDWVFSIKDMMFGGDQGNVERFQRRYRTKWK